MRPYKLIVVCLLLPLTKTIGQGKLTSIRPIYQVIDSVKDVDGYILRISWMDTIIEIKRTTKIKYNLEFERKFRKDDSYLPTPKDTLQNTEMLRFFAQNCASYAFERYFASVGLENNLFNKWTTLMKSSDMDKILFNSFEKISSQPIRNKRCKNCSFTVGSILVFRNKGNMPVHIAYYDGKFHSKYGGWGPKSDENISTILKSYWDSKTVDEYKFGQKKNSTIP